MEGNLDFLCPVQENNIFRIPLKPIQALNSAHSESNEIWIFFCPVQENSIFRIRFKPIQALKSAQSEKHQNDQRLQINFNDQDT